MSFAEGGGLLAPDEVALGIENLLRGAQVVVLVVVELGLGVALLRGLDPHRVGASQAAGLPAVFGSELGGLLPHPDQLTVELRST